MTTSFIKWYKQFKDKYIVRQRRQHEYFVNRYYAHLVDPFFTKLVYDLKLTPNIVTIIAGILGIGAGISFFFQQWILGALLLQLHHLMDGADGNLARLTNQCSEFGAKLDQWVDQVVRLVLFVSIAFVVDLPLLIKVLFVATIYIDIAIVHNYVLPFMQKYPIIRSKWKEWFLSKGIIPAFDIFLIYFLISIFAIIGRLDILVYIVIIGKNIDWVYRVWECMKSKYIYKAKLKVEN
ncbi:CDP-alcohol phosphatidyltransferase family protein [Alkalihalobacterium sp. APHAB7]|uniref:CDP-alcohol phosphatidyltransferase family protein n=1 Tax=Alkalihalobacterium sp. APHAB7 TaxID=3402081 RepID=UPI003AB0BD34